MRKGRLPDGSLQDFYFLDTHPSMPGWFKGMELIIRERGLWPSAGLRASCPNFKCSPGNTSCCCRRLLFCQPDFVAQKPLLQEIIEERGHICDFYPKYHCELNFIEQYWGAAKQNYRNQSRAATLEDMQRNVLNALESVSIDKIRK
jgi:hypothetical protein